MIKECCQKLENLEQQPSEKSELIIRKCKVCDCRHFELNVDPGKLGLKGERL